MLHECMLPAAHCIVHRCIAARPRRQRCAGRNTNTSQFFITFSPQHSLDGKHVRADSRRGTRRGYSKGYPATRIIPYDAPRNVHIAAHPPTRALETCLRRALVWLGTVRRLLATGVSATFGSESCAAGGVRTGDRGGGHREAHGDREDGEGPAHRRQRDRRARLRPVVTCPWAAA